MRHPASGHAAGTKRDPPDGEVRQALVLGGAGFVGSAIARAFVRAGWFVTIIDNLDPLTFADPSRLANDLDAVRFERSAVEDVSDLPSRFCEADVVVNAIGWTRHSEGERHPGLDLRLNLGVHLPIFDALRESGPLFVHLGSRHQFGGLSGQIDDDAAFAPLDAQSIHKCAAEDHLRRICRRTGCSAVALRIGNCIGPGQPIVEGDVGLIGTFIRDLQDGRTLAVYGGERRRDLCFTPDVGAITVALANDPPRGFLPMNVPGISVDIADLADRLARALGRGSIVREAMPDDIARREISAGRFVGSALTRRLPAFVPTSLDESLRITLSHLPIRSAMER